MIDIFAIVRSDLLTLPSKCTHSLACYRKIPRSLSQTLDAVSMASRAGGELEVPEGVLV
jgi:hypothetical protein